MSLIKFLLIDTALLIIGIPLLMSLQRGKNKLPLLGNLNSNIISDQSNTKLPSLNELLELERLAKKTGSGIDYNSLIADWKFISVWKKESDKEDLLASSLLRLFLATLELKEDLNEDSPNKYEITNSIQFGSLLIRFVGSGELKGSQPLLPFYFKIIELKLGSKVLLSRSIQTPDTKNRPFFGLISIEENGKWLAARGRGGGLALWLRD